MNSANYAEAVLEGAQMLGVVNQSGDTSHNQSSRFTNWTKKPCRIVCTTIIMLLLSTLIALVKMTMDLIRDVMDNEKIVQVIQSHLNQERNMSIICNNTVL